MEIHKPKPIHGWRDFIKEIGIIVLSILIALGLEQTVEYFHWRHEVDMGRKAIAAEIMVNNRWLSRRVAIAPCMDRMIGETRAILDAMENKHPPKAFTVFHSSGVGAVLSVSEWEAERASQVLTHFPRAELALMSRYYAIMPQFGFWMNEETAAWSELSGLRNLPAGLSASDILRLRGNLDTARRVEFLILFIGQQNLKLSDALGIPRVGPEPGRVEAFCKMDDDQSNAMLLRMVTRP